MMGCEGMEAGDDEAPSSEGTASTTEQRGLDEQQQRDIKEIAKQGMKKQQQGMKQQVPPVRDVTGVTERSKGRILKLRYVGRCYKNYWRQGVKQRAKIIQLRSRCVKPKVAKRIRTARSSCSKR